MPEISKYEMDRRRLIANVRGKMLAAMEAITVASGGLTAAEWLKVLYDLEARMLADCLKEEWSEHG